MATVTGNVNLTPNTEDILKEVRNFVKGSSLRSKVSNEELARSALFLLRTLPSARQAVLEHLCTVFNDAVRSHLDIGNKASGEEVSELDAVIQDVKDVMMGFIKSSPAAWAPIISAWAIELLGQISGEYTGRRAVPMTSSLNELLQLWMTCSPTSVLIEIASECFASMVGDMPDVCVSSLLEASVKHSPHFDWVVAHIGSCFPTTIITRVLICGLKDFYTHGGDQSAPAVTEEKVPKLASVVGILGHLATQHRADIRTALTALFQESLRPDCEDMHVAAVPFLLHLASMSPLLLRVITLDFVTTVTPSVLNSLARQLTQKRAHVQQDKNQLVMMLVHLVSTGDVGSYRILQFLLDNAIPRPHKDDAMDTGEVPLEMVQQTCATVMEHLLLELQQTVQRRGSRSGEVTFLLSLQDHATDLCRQLVKAEGQRYEWLCRIMCCMATYCDDSCAALILSTIIQEAAESAQLGVFIRIQNEAQIFHPDVLTLTSRTVLESLGSHQETPLSARNTLRNMLWVAQWETKQAARCTARHKLQDAMHTGLGSLTPCLYHNDTEVAALAMELLNIVGLPRNLGMDTLTRLCCSTANFFFRCLHSPEPAVKCHNARLCQRYMASLSDHVTAQRLLTRLLLHKTLNKEHAPVFGSKVDVVLSSRDEVNKPTAQLLPANMRHASSNLPHGRVRVFHGGVIGRGLKPLPQPSAYTQEEQLCNCHLVVDALWLCNTTMDTTHTDDDAIDAPPGTPPSSRPGTPTRPAPTTIHPMVGRAMALLLVELIAPDVMYNGIPWPEEDFMKVTVERDLQIRKTFDDNPVLWDFMEVLAHSPGAVVYCSALLRGVAATLIVQWDSCREKTARNMPRHLLASQRLMECLRKGALLSSPLCHVGELFPDLAPHEVCLLLQTVWRYIKENPPVPDPNENLARGCDRRFTDVVQSIVHTNIDTLGHLYSRFNSRPVSIVIPPSMHLPPGHTTQLPPQTAHMSAIAERLMNHANSVP